MLIERRSFLGVLGAGSIAAALPSVSAAPVFPKKAIIRTVLKDVAPETLGGGATLFHEHMSLAPDFLPRWGAYSRPNQTAPLPDPAKVTPPVVTLPAGQKFFLEDIDLMVAEMRSAKDSGVACLVDGGHEDMGRSLDFLRRLSEQSGMPIIAGTGFYAQPFYSAEVSKWSEEQMTRELVRLVNTQPVGAFGEIGSWDDITDTERRVFRAIGKAHLETNLPIFTHTGIPGRSALEQLDIFEKVGVKPEHIVIGHLGNLVDPEAKVQKEICKRGAFVGFDRQGGQGDVRQVPMVMKLIEAGYADKVMLASDFSNPGQLKKNGGAGYAKTVTVFGPKLREAGVSEAMLHGILVDNPRRFLAFVPKKRRK